MTRATARRLSSWASPPPPDPGEMGRRPGSLDQPNRGWGHRFGPQVGTPSRGTPEEMYRDRHRVAAWDAAPPRNTERRSNTKPRTWLGEQISEVRRRWSAPPPTESSRATEWPAVTLSTPRRRDESSSGTGSLMAEVVEVGGCPSDCPRFKERRKWACT